MPRYLVVIEKGTRNYGAYAPDVPGCVTTGKTLEETRALMEEALAFHLRGLVEDHEPIPEPVSEAVYVTIPEPRPAQQTSPDPRQLTDQELWERVRALKGRTVFTLVKGRKNVIEDVSDTGVTIRGRASRISRTLVIEAFRELKASGRFKVQKHGEEGHRRPSFGWNWFLVPALLREALGRDQVEIIPGIAGIQLKETLAKAS